VLELYVRRGDARVPLIVPLTPPARSRHTSGDDAEYEPESDALRLRKSDVVGVAATG
jgi:hypothetical protein